MDSRYLRISVLWIALLGLPAMTVSADPFVYAADATDNRISVVDIETGEVVAGLPTGQMPAGSAISPDGKWLFVAATGDGSLKAFDLDTGETTVVDVGGGPSGVAVDPVEPVVYVANSHDDTVSAIDFTEMNVIATIPVGAAPLDVAADGLRVWVTNFGADTVSVIDPVTQTVVDTVAVGAKPAGVVTAADASRVWVANLFDDTVTVIDTAGLTVAATVAVSASPRGLAIAPAGDRVFVAGFGNGEVTVLDTSANAVLSTVPAGLNAADVAVTPNGDRLVVADPAAGELRVLDTASLQPLAGFAAGEGHVTVAGFAGAPPAAPVNALKVPTTNSLALAGLAIMLAAFGGFALYWRRRAAVLFLPLVFVLGGLMVATPAESQASFQINDGTLANADWEKFQVMAGEGSETANQGTFGGNPGTYRDMSHNHASGDGMPFTIEVIHRYVGQDATYDPDSLGAIDSLDASWERRSNLDGVDEVEENFVVFQNGTAYVAKPEAFSGSSWTSASRTDLVAADFNDGSGNPPDFSAEGAPLTFGFLRRTTSADGFAGHDLDNFTVTVSGDQSPPPGESGILAFEFPSYVAVAGDSATLRVRRTGGSSGAVSAVVLLPPGGQNVSWSDGDSDPKTIKVELSGMPGLTEIRILKPILTEPTGGAEIHPVRDTTVLFVLPPDSGLEALALLLGLLLSATGPLWLLLGVIAASYAIWRRRVSIVR